MRKILFRCNSSSSIGLGHIKRDLVLAKEYHKDNVSFACEDLESNINSEVIKNGYELIVLKNNSVLELAELINKKLYDLVVIDSYDINYEFEKELKERTKCELMVFDDTYEKHYCDVLLNHNLYAKEFLYKKKVPSFTKLLCGEKYTLIRDEFKEFKKTSKTKSRKILICLGGVDEFNITSKVVRVLEEFNLEINVITSSSNKNLNLLKSNKDIKLHINTSSMASLINDSLFTIISPSVIVHEVLYMEKSFITIQTAKNQKYMHEYLLENSYYALSEFNEKELKAFIQKLLGELT